MAATGAEVDRLWDEFHAVVNMTSEQLRAHLLTGAAGPDGFGSAAHLGVDPEGEKIVRLLAKRKTDLTGEDVELMRKVSAEIGVLRAGRPPRGAADRRWRHDLMNLGHDPLREDLSG